MAVARHHHETDRDVRIRVERAELPDYHREIGIFGSRNDSARLDAGDDNHGELMSYLYPFHREG